MAGRITKALARPERVDGVAARQWKGSRWVMVDGLLVSLAEGVVIVNSQPYLRTIKVPGKQP